MLPGWCSSCSGDWTKVGDAYHRFADESKSAQWRRLLIQTVRVVEQSDDQSSLTPLEMCERTLPFFYFLFDRFFFFLMVIVNHSLSFRFCSICLSDIAPEPKGGRLDGEADDRGLCVLPCGHGFHGPCIAEWKSRSDTCPYCRAQNL